MGDIRQPTLGQPKHRGHRWRPTIIHIGQSHRAHNLQKKGHFAKKCSFWEASL